MSDKTLIFTTKDYELCVELLDAILEGDTQRIADATLHFMKMLNDFSDARNDNIRTHKAIL